MNTQISIVLGTYNRHAFLKAAIESVRDNGITVPYEIIVVDGGSTDGSLPWLLRQKDVITIVQHNRGTFRGKPIPRRSWGYFMNLGFKAAQGKYILMISDDCLLVPGAVMKGVEHAEALRALGRNIGAVAFYWRDWPDQREYKIGLTLGEKMFVNHGLYQRQALDSVGWIDEEHYRFYHADGDLCLKLWLAGYEVVDAPDSFVEHFAHAAPQVRRDNSILHTTDWLAYVDKWGGIFYDPLQPSQGKWCYRVHTDSYQTVNRFPKKAVLLHGLRLDDWLQSVATRLKKGTRWLFTRL